MILSHNVCVKKFQTPREREMGIGLHDFAFRLVVMNSATESI
jgi:hypothetical protein